MWRSCGRVASKGQTEFRYFIGEERSEAVASETPGAEEGKGEEDLRCSSLLTVCQSHLGLSTCQKMKRQGWSSSVWIVRLASSLKKFRAFYCTDVNTITTLFFSFVTYWSVAR